MTCPKCHTPMFGEYCICGHRDVRISQKSDKCPKCGVQKDGDKCALCDSVLGEIFGMGRDSQ